MAGLENYYGLQRETQPAASCPVTQACQMSLMPFRFEASNTEACRTAPAVPEDCITLSVADVSKTFKQINIHKAAGPDGLPGRVLKAGADQLASGKI